MSRRRRQSPIFAIAVDLFRECRANFVDYISALYVAAERETNGVLLNARGQAAGIDAESLLYGPRVRLEAYGSEELIDFVARRGRTTFADFEKTWIAGRTDLAS